MYSLKNQVPGCVSLSAEHQLKGTVTITRTQSTAWHPELPKHSLNKEHIFRKSKLYSEALKFISSPPPAV